jgi:hypothetical protein
MVKTDGVLQHFLYANRINGQYKTSIITYILLVTRSHWLSTHAWLQIPFWTIIGYTNIMGFEWFCIIPMVVFLPESRYAMGTSGRSSS